MDHNLFNPSTYINVPNNEVDWASLAKRWIQTKFDGDVEVLDKSTGGEARGVSSEAMGHTLSVRPSAGYGYPTQAHIPPCASLSASLAPPYYVRPLPPPGFFNPPADFRPQFFNNRPQPFTTPKPHIPPVSYSSSTFNSTLKFNPVPPLFQAASNATSTAESSDSKWNKNNNNSEEIHMPDYEVDGAMAHWMNDTNNDPAHWIDNRIDQASRKKLPQWILEGLEKAEQEKRKQMEREQKVQEDLKKDSEREARRRAKGKGKFDSDSEDDGDDFKQLDAKRVFASDSVIKEKMTVRCEDLVENKTRAVKRLMFSILMQASEVAIEDQFNKAFERFKKLGRRVVASTSASNALTAIAQYTDDEETTDDEKSEDKNRVVELSEGFKRKLEKDLSEEQQEANKGNDCGRNEGNDMHNPSKRDHSNTDETKTKGQTGFQEEKFKARRSSDNEHFEGYSCKISKERESRVYPGRSSSNERCHQSGLKERLGKGFSNDNKNEANRYDELRADKCFKDSDRQCRVDCNGSRSAYRKSNDRRRGYDDYGDSIYKRSENYDYRTSDTKRNVRSDRERKESEKRLRSRSHERKRSRRS
ncbi:unnamed protein product [Bursaphelenchus okinawaensis]|uniref:Uncharacterized protein n=1 Tax=Bursaphelenchus okinawaensis TaxID=465554 RepID=A0A811JX89_9BILA|nr:unnamed protein product [Bursaphelenchus okinawaensis]CAG9086883.1 unnamed protein product [Bursaphelenchus okinawaensis]